MEGSKTTIETMSDEDFNKIREALLFALPNLPETKCFNYTQSRILMNICRQRCQDLIVFEKECLYLEIF